MYLGPPIDDPAILESLPPELVDLLRRANGYVAYDGGLHVRGACHTPDSDGIVHRLDSEVGELEALDVDLADFDAAVRADPVSYLRLQPLERFRADGGILQPGQLLSIYPPYVFEESGKGVSMRAISADDRLGFLAGLAAAIRDVPDGTRIAIPPVPPT